MIHLVLYAARKEDSTMLLSAIRQRVAMGSAEELDCKIFLQPAEAAECLRTAGATAIGWDMSEEQSRLALVSARDRCRSAYLLVVANADTSPLTFLNPTISPSSLVIRPLTPPEIERVAREMMEALQRSPASSEDYFTITSRDQQQCIPYADIYYFEARGRKLYARLRCDEIGFTGTLEQLETELPKMFQRCHRSFIINTSKIERIQLSQNIILLWDGLDVPLSRSYKKAIKERSNKYA